MGHEQDGGEQEHRAALMRDGERDRLPCGMAERAVEGVALAERVEHEEVCRGAGGDDCDIRIESEHGAGTSVHFTIPKARELTEEANT